MVELRNRMSTGVIATALAISVIVLAAIKIEPLYAQRPNILWITAEDMSPTLGCYGDDFATSPNIDRFARQSTRYTHAFASAPVCSPSRACLINGVIATTQGTHAMRSLFPLPKNMTGFPALLRQAGYYTTNNVKTDYNSAAESSIIEASWDDNSETAHWRGRTEDQSFFAVFNLMTSHQSRTMVWPYEQFVEEVQSKLRPDMIHDPAMVPLPPYYPDTLLVRQTVARYYDCVAVMDQQVGELLAELDADGLTENTIVFFFSDHGSGMPRHKRVLYDSGTHVPLLVRFPEQYRGHSPGAAGELEDRLVSFDDFGPTVLSLAGIKSLPAYMKGRPFLGPLRTPPRNFLVGHRDRVDEMVDMARSLRSHDYLYIRNFMPHLGYNQPSAWIDQGEIRGEFYKLAESGNATPAQAQYLNGIRESEELYDCAADPLNLNNLADSSKHEEVLARMRSTLADHMLQSRDLGLVPEIEMWRHVRDSGIPPMEWSATDEFEPDSLLHAAQRVGSDDYDAIARSIEDPSAAVRYWGAVACSAAKDLPLPLIERLAGRLDDESPAVQIEAATALVRHGLRKSEALGVLVKLLDHSDQTVILHAARAIELLGEESTRGAMRRLADRFENEPGDLAWFIRFSTTGYLQRIQ